MKQVTLWNKNIKSREMHQIPNHLEIDILIIGGGLAGISTLFELRHHKENVALIERDKIGFGVTSRTTGKLTFMQGLCYQKIEKIYNFDTARLYHESQKDAIKHAKHNIVSHNIECEYHDTEAFVFTNESKEKEALEKELEFYQKLKVACKLEKKIPFDIPLIYSLNTSGSAVFNPVMYLYRLAEIAAKNGAKIYEGVGALTITKKDDKYEVKTTSGSILANKIIVTTHYPFFLHPGWIPLKSHIEESFVITAKTDKIQPYQAINEEKPTHSFRYATDKEENYFLYAGSSLKTSNHFDTKKIMDEMKEKLENHFHAESLYTWHTHDIMTNDSLPFIGRINQENPNFYIATGFNKWGMTNSIISSLIIRDLIDKKETKYQKIFAPDRKLNFEKFKNFFVDGYQNMKSIGKAKLIRQQSFYQDCVQITYENGIRIGIYIDETGKIHKVRNLCPHMKCNLIFNTLDKTWDCPCHGSRFDIDGNVIEGPSVYDIKLKKEDH